MPVMWISLKNGWIGIILFCPKNLEFQNFAENQRNRKTPVQMFALERVKREIQLSWIQSKTEA